MRGEGVAKQETEKRPKRHQRLKGDGYANDAAGRCSHRAAMKERKATWKSDGGRKETMRQEKGI